MERKIYTKEEVYESSLAYFQGDKPATQIWMDKYAQKDIHGNFYETTPEDRLWQLANEIARIERHYNSTISAQEIFHLFDHFRYLIVQDGLSISIEEGKKSPFSRNFVIGRDSSSCAAIFKTEEEQMQLMKRGANVGHDLSYICPDVFLHEEYFTGLPAIMKHYAGNTIPAKSLLSMSLSVNHPQAAAFISAKSSVEELDSCNTFIKVEDDFMRAAIENKDYQQKYLSNSHSQESITIEAKALWNSILHQTWQTGNLRVCFWNNLQKESIPDVYPAFKSTSLAPLSEMPLCPYDANRGLVINLYAYVVNPFRPEAHFDMDLFQQHAALATRIMDDVIDLEIERIDAILAEIEADPENNDLKQTERSLWQNIKQKALQGRRIGIGVTGEGDMLAALNLSYASEKALDFAEKIHQALAVNVYKTSVDLAKERGAFEIFDAKKEENQPFLRRLFEASPDMKKNMGLYGRRNIACLNIAPIGSLALMAQTTSGIEPAFSLIYKNHYTTESEDGSNEHTSKEEICFHPKFKVWMEKQSYDTQKSYEQDELKAIIAQSPYFKATTKEIDCLQKIKMQGRIQKWTDHSVKASIYLPTDATEELIHLIYMEAWRSGCKSCSIYREGAGISAPKKDDKKNAYPPSLTPIRPKELEADVLRFQNNKDKWIAFIGLQNNRPYEIFTGIQDDDDGIALPKNVTHGKIIKNMDENGMKRYDFQFSNRRGYKTTVEGLSDKFNPEYWNYAKLISGVLRYGMPIDQVIKLVGSLELDSKSINTWKTGVERALKNYLPEEDLERDLEKEDIY